MDESLSKRSLRLIGHYAGLLLPVAALAYAAVKALRAALLWGTPASDVIATAETWAFGPAWVTAYILIIRHDVRLCERCMASMPLDPSARAARRPRLLRLGHFVAMKMAFLVVLVGYTLAIALAGYLVFGPRTQGQALLSALALMPPVALILFAGRWHMRYKPWCPDCRTDGGGGGGGKSPVPDGPGGRELPLPSR